MSWDPKGKACATMAETPVEIIDSEVLPHQVGHVRSSASTSGEGRWHKCDSCDYSCNRLDNLKSHKLVHSRDKPYKCDSCDYSCNRLDRLKHHKLGHSGVKLYKCDSCDYSCNYLYSINNHKLVHKKVKPYKCDVCDHSFIKKDNLILHKRVHSGVKPYKCDVRDYSCNILSRLKRHKLVHHRASEADVTQTEQDKKHLIIVEETLSNNYSDSLHICMDCEYFTESVYMFQNHILEHREFR